MEINLSTEIIHQIIDKSKAFHCKEDVVIPEDENEISEEDYMQILADHDNDMTYREVRDAINDLEPDQQMTLVAVMYLGRGDFSIEEWDDCYAEAEDGWTSHTAEYLLSKPMLADYLEEGLSMLGLEN